MAHRGRRSVTRRDTSKKTEKIWTSVVSTGGLVTTTAISTDIVQPVDWERSAVAREHATLVRIRGSICVINEVAGVTYNAFIIRILESRGNPDPSSAAALVDEDVLWTYGYSSTEVVVSPQVVDIDVKAKRRIASTDDVRFIEISSGANGFSTSNVFRGLLLVA